MTQEYLSSKMYEIMNRIKERRISLDLSYQEMADKTGLSKSTLQRYETGYIKNMPIDKLEILAKVLDIEPSYLMGWDEPTPTTPTPTNDLSASESVLIEGYRQLNEEGKDYIDRQMDFAICQDDFKKRDSLEISKKKA